MAEVINSRFTRWNFSESEVIQSAILSPLTELHIQNELAEATETKLLIAYNPDSPNATQEFIGEHEYWRGYCAALNNLLNLSLDSIERLKNELNAEPTFNFSENYGE